MGILNKTSRTSGLSEIYEPDASGLKPPFSVFNLYIKHKVILKLKTEAVKEASHSRQDANQSCSL